MGKTGNEFTKTDLQNRMVVKNRDGEYKIVCDNMLMGRLRFGKLSDYNDDLTHIRFDNLDIMQIYYPINYLYPMLVAEDPDREKIDMIHGCCDGLILRWERNEQITKESLDELVGYELIVGGG